MARTVYSSRLAYRSGNAGSSNFPVPAGFVWVIREVAISVNAPSGQNAYVLTVADDLYIASFAPTGAGPALYLQEHRTVLVAGETLELGSNVAGQVAIRVSGYQLSA